jgi:hypothetical protein
MPKYPAIIFVQSCKIPMSNVFTGESKVFVFNRGEETHARLDEKGAGQIYFLDDDGWGAIINKDLVELKS